MGSWAPWEQGAVYYLSDTNLGTIEFDTLMTEWRNEGRIQNSQGAISYLLRSSVLIGLYSYFKFFSFLCLPFTDGRGLTIRNPNPKEVKTLLWELSEQWRLQTFHWVYGVKFFLCIHHQQAWFPWSKIQEDAFTRTMNSLGLPFCLTYQKAKNQSNSQNHPHFVPGPWYH